MNKIIQIVINTAWETQNAIKVVQNFIITFSRFCIQKLIMNFKILNSAEYFNIRVAFGMQKIQLGRLKSFN